MERPTGLIYLSMNEHVARFYLGLLNSFQDQQREEGLRFDAGVADDIKWLKKEMELRRWPETQPGGEED
jgi:hypothetical protein